MEKIVTMFDMAEQTYHHDRIKGTIVEGVAEECD